MNINEYMAKNGSKLIGFVLIFVFAGLSAYIAYQIFTPIDPETTARLEEEIVGTKISFDSAIIERVEKRKDYGRAIETAYVDANREQFQKTGVPQNFFDSSRLKKYY